MVRDRKFVIGSDGYLIASKRRSSFYMLRRNGWNFSRRRCPVCRLYSIIIKSLKLSNDSHDCQQKRVRSYYQRSLKNLVLCPRFPVVHSGHLRGKRILWYLDMSTKNLNCQRDLMKQGNIKRNKENMLFRSISSDPYALSSTPTLDYMKGRKDIKVHSDIRSNSAHSFFKFPSLCKSKNRHRNEKSTPTSESPSKNESLSSSKCSVKSSIISAFKQNKFMRRDKPRRKTTNILPQHLLDPGSNNFCSRSSENLLGKCSSGGSVLSLNTQGCRRDSKDKEDSVVDRSVIRRHPKEQNSSSTPTQSPTRRLSFIEIRSKIKDISVRRTGSSPCPARKSLMHTPLISYKSEPPPPPPLPPSANECGDKTLTPGFTERVKFMRMSSCDYTDHSSDSLDSCIEKHEVKHSIPKEISSSFTTKDDIPWITSPVVERSVKSCASGHGCDGWSICDQNLSAHLLKKNNIVELKKNPKCRDSIVRQVEGNEEKKARGVSLRRLSRPRHSDERPPATSDSNGTQSDTDVGKISGPIIRVNNGGLVPSDAPLEMSRVGAWALSFEKLIEDPAGLHTFAEFLKKEYSHENIYFWTACERYRMLTDEEDRRELAKAIFDRHLGMSASEPVNVDSQARQVAQDGLANPDEFLFTAAQKQIFNLMKFDSYSRFLKSDLYNTCLTHDRKGLPLPYPGEDTLDPDLGLFFENSFSTHLKKSKSDAEERRRKSLLPWHRKDRSKSKDRGEAEYWRKKKLGHRTPSESSSARYDLSDSHTSLSSSDFAPANRAVSKESLTSGEAVSLSGSEGLSLCRFILPDQSNSVLAVKSGETVKELVRQLLDRRRINFTEFNVVLTKGNKVVDLNKDSTVLGGYEVRLERMVLFSLYLPSRKTVIVKAKPHKLVSEVLKPILSKYGLKLDLMVIHKCGETKPISLKGSVTDLDGEKLIVQTKEEVKEWSEPGRVPKRNTTLDEITNKVFADLLNGKTKSSFDDLGILDFDSRSTKTEPTSETSSIIGSFGRRESLSLERNLPSRQSGSGRGLLGDNSFGSKRNPSTYNIKTKQENADLYEGLKRAQMYRLDDQRGTEINFELPDFLKSDRGQTTTLLSHFDGSFRSNSSEGTEQSEFLSRAHPEVWGGVEGDEDPATPNTAENTLIASTELDLDDLEETLRPIEKERSSGSNSSSSNSSNNNIKSNSNSSNNNKRKADVPTGPPSPYLTPPPPLPPKPKFGGALRGPPPRPPSRQLPSLSHSLHLLDVPIHLAANRPPPTLSEKLSVSFV